MDNSERVVTVNMTMTVTMTNLFSFKKHKMTDFEDPIFSSIFEKPEGDLQGGPIAVDHLMSDLRVRNLNLRTFVI